MKNILIIIFFSHIIFISGISQAIDYESKASLLQDQINRIKEIPELVEYEKLDYINGIQHYPYANKYIHPFFQNNMWNSGKVYLGSEEYILDAVKYDIVSDNLVFLYFKESSAYQIYFNKVMVRQFSIDNHDFKYLDNAGNISGKLIVPGYYEVIYDGKTKLYIRWEKTKVLFDTHYDGGYSQKIEYFLYKEDEFIKIKKNKCLINALDDHKPEVRNFIKKNSINIKADDMGPVIHILKFYDNL